MQASKSQVYLNSYRERSQTSTTKLLTEEQAFLPRGLLCCQQMAQILLFFLHRGVFVSRRLNRKHRSALALLVLASGMYTLGEADSAGGATRQFCEICLNSVDNFVVFACYTR